MPKVIPAVFFQKQIDGVKEDAQKPERLELFESQLVDMGPLVETLGKRYGGWYPFAAESAQTGAGWRAVPWYWVAFPATYGVSGVMTFIVNHDGVVYQKDLGPNTAARAGALKQFDPGAGWTKA